MRNFRTNVCFNERPIIRFLQQGSLVLSALSKWHLFISSFNAFVKKPIHPFLEKRNTDSIQKQTSFPETAYLFLNILYH